MIHTPSSPEATVCDPVPLCPGPRFGHFGRYHKSYNINATAALQQTLALAPEVLAEVPKGRTFFALGRFGQPQTDG